MQFRGGFPFSPSLEKSFPVFDMRKTRLVILPTKCLNQMGFLLLFLSCPVIGDWGRIRPESEMSQRSILIEREGSCGLVKNPISLGVKNSPSEKLKECLAYNGRPMNGTQNSVSVSPIVIDATPFASETPMRRAVAQRRVTNIGKIKVNGEKPRAESEERSVRRETRSLSVRDAKERRKASERRAAQTGNAYRNAGRLNRSESPQRLLRRTYQEKSYRSVNNRRSENQREGLSIRNRESRIAGKNQDRSQLVTRRITSALREREVKERREKNNFERTLRLIENVRRRSANEMKARELTARSERRQPGEARWARRTVGDDRRADDVEKQVENRKLTRYDAREMQNLKNDQNVRRVNNRERILRRVASNSERIRAAERRNFQEERKLQNDGKRLNNIRRSTIKEREVVQNRRNENSNERSVYTKRSTETGERYTRENRVRTPNQTRQRRSISRRMNQPEIGNRRESEYARNNRERNEGITTRAAIRENDQKSRRLVADRRQIHQGSIGEKGYLVRKERSIDISQGSERRNDLMRAQRRIESNQSRRIREDRAVGMAAIAKERTNESKAERYLERAADQKMRTTKMERMVQHDQPEILTREAKMGKMEGSEQWKFLDSAKSWINLKNYQEPQMADYKDFTTTCLVGAAVFFLTIHPVKSA